MLCSIFRRRTQLGLKVTISYAMFAIRTPDPTRITKVTVSYAMFDVPTSGPNPAPFFGAQIRLKVKISYAMSAVPTPGPNRSKSNDQLCCVRCSDAGPQPDQNVTISYAMFDSPTDSVDFRSPPRANVDHSRMARETRPLFGADHLASSE